MRDLRNSALANSLSFSISKKARKASCKISNVPEKHHVKYPKVLIGSIIGENFSIEVGFNASSV